MKKLLGKLQRNFHKLAPILIASVTMLAAITAFLQAYANTQAELADRRAQEFAIQATNQRVSGAVQFSYDWQSAFQTYRELGLQIISAEQEEDYDTADRYRELRQQIAALSPLLGQPYFDDESGWPDSAKYEAELYVVEATRLTEKFTAEAEQGNRWDRTANIFVIQLTLLAVTLSLFGMSTTIRSWVRWLFLAVGSSIVAVNLVWMVLVLFVPWPTLSYAAIDAYAEGTGMAYQGKHEEAIALYDSALQIEPTYATVLYERGNAHYSLGNYEQAADDYQAAKEAGRDDTNVGWNLGWTLYLLGRFDESVLVNQHVLTLDSTIIGVRMNQGLALLAQGRFDNAGIEYNLTLEEAARQVTEAHDAGQEPPSSLWFYLDAGAADLESLAAQLDNAPKPWTQAPTANLITADPAGLRAFANEQIAAIKQMAVALEFTGLPPTPPTSATAAAFEFGDDVYDENGEFLRYDIFDTFPYRTNDVIILFEYENIPAGTQEVWKVYRNGFEDPALRVVGEWALESEGRALKRISYAYSNVFIFTPGEYVVEFYANSQLLQRGTFVVEEP